MERSNALLYGKGIFTTVAIRNGRPLLWDMHWRRSTRDAKKVDIDISEFSSEGILAMLNGRVTHDGVTDGRARITFFDQRSSKLWPAVEPEQQAVVQIIAGERRPVPAPFRLTRSPCSVNSCSPLAGVKSCNYLEQILAKDEAKGRGFDEAIRMNERAHITGGCMANVFWVKDDRLFTPALSTGCLPGTTREFVLENLECEEVEAEISDLEAAEAIFLTSAGLGVVAVNEFDGRTLACGDHPIVQLWRDLETK